MFNTSSPDKLPQNAMSTGAASEIYTSNPPSHIAFPLTSDSTLSPGIPSSSYSEYSQSRTQFQPQSLTIPPPNFTPHTNPRARKFLFPTRDLLNRPGRPNVLCKAAVEKKRQERDDAEKAKSFVVMTREVKDGYVDEDDEYDADDERDDEASDKEENGEGL